MHNVFKNQIDALVRAAEAGIPSAMAFLEDRTETITGMFAWVGDSGFEDSAPENQAAFEEAKKTWQRYLSQAKIVPAREHSVHDFDEAAKIAANLRSRSR